MTENSSMEDYTRAQDTLDFLVGLIEAEAVASRFPRETSSEIPVGVIAGFLGAGKTTLLRHLLTGKHGLKIAAVVNDFAALNIDAGLISEVSNDTVALANGCICCSQSGGASRALFAIASRQVRPDFILIETSGVADPWALSSVANSVKGVTLDFVATVVDVSAVSEVPSIEFLLHRQVAAADMILLNKTDLVAKDKVDAAEKYVAALAPNAQVLRTVACAIPYSIIFDRTIRSADALNGDDVQAFDGDQLFASRTLAATGPIDRTGLESCLANLPDGIFRAKGFLLLTDSPNRPELLQVVGRRWSWKEAPETTETGQLVVIGLAELIESGRMERHFEPVGLIALSE